MRTIRLPDFLRNYDSRDPHHRAALNALQDEIPRYLLVPTADWVIMYKERVDPKDGATN